MTPEQRILLTLALMPCLLALRWLAASLPLRPPLRLPLGALAAQALQGSIASLWPQAPGLVWLTTITDLLAAYGLIQLAIWFALLPAILGAWRQPPRILRDLLMLVLGAVVTVVVLRERAGVNLVGLVTTSAVLTAVIGLAAQETLRDLMAGVTLQLERPFHEGDWISLEQGSGEVEAVTLMSTVLRNLDGAQIRIPNAVVGQSSIKRCGPGDAMGLRLRIGLHYDLPPAQAMALLRQVVRQHPKVLAHPEPEVWLEAYGSSAINYQVLAWQRHSREANELQLRSELLSQIWYVLDRGGHPIPYPVQEWRLQAPTAATASPASDPATPMPTTPAPDRATLLAANPLFGHLDPGARQQLAGQCRRLRFGPGETILREGDAGDSLYQVVSGQLEVLREGSGPEQQPVARLGPGNVVGEMALFSGTPRTATVRACGETVLLEVERQDLLPLIQADPTLVERLAHLVSQRQAELERLSSATAAQQERTLIQRMRQLFEVRARPEPN